MRGHSAPGKITAAALAAVFGALLAVIALIPAPAYASGSGGAAEAACAHVFGDWVQTAAPTHLREGSETRTCVICGAAETQAVPKLYAADMWVSEGESLYYLGSDGLPYRGWHKMKPYGKTKTKWCFFTPDGAYTKSISRKTRSKWVSAAGRKFYFTKKRRPAKPGFNYIRGRLYYMDELGAMVRGRFTDGGETYRTAKDGSISGTEYYRHKYKTFILVDISDQTLKYYRRGKLKLKADVVTGRSGGDTATPTGTYSVRSKSRNVRLTGSTWDVHVDYWIAFLGSSYGFHDASWRSSRDFSNKRAYISNGSHGCVNMKSKDAAALYRRVSVGTRVIIQN